MGLTKTAEGLLELLPHFKGFSDREAAPLSTVSSFLLMHAARARSVCVGCACVCIRGE